MKKYSWKMVISSLGKAPSENITFPMLAWLKVITRDVLSPTRSNWSTKTEDIVVFGNFQTFKGRFQYIYIRKFSKSYFLDQFCMDLLWKSMKMLYTDKLIMICVAVPCFENQSLFLYLQQKCLSFLEICPIGKDLIYSVHC